MAIWEKSRKSKPFHNIKNSQLCTNLLLILSTHFFWKHWFSIISLLTLHSCYKNMVLTSAWLSIGWNTSGRGPYQNPTDRPTTRLLELPSADNRDIKICVFFVEKIIYNWKRTPTKINILDTKNKIMSKIFGMPRA